jgi:hypothetical protein
MQQQQAAYATQFNQNLPQLQQQTASQLGQQAAAKNTGQMSQAKSSDSARGLGYGGIAEGTQAQIGAQNTAGLMNSINQSNTNLQNAGNTLNAQALETGVGIQQTQQSIQNQVYQQALAQQNANNTITGSAMGTGILAGMLFL